MSVRLRLALVAVASILLVTACTPTSSVGPTPAPPDGPSAASVADGPVVAFYGDSYTRGTGASSAEKRWSTIVSAERGWHEINRSENGLGFVNRRTSVEADIGDIPSQVIDDDPDIVFVTMGLNDNFSFDAAAERIRAAIDDDLERLRAGLPEARLVVVEPFWYTADRPDSVAVISGWVEQAADRDGADWIGGAGRWLDGHYAGSSDSWMAADDLHPNDEGYAHMAEQMDAALRSLDPPL